VIGRDMSEEIRHGVKDEVAILPVTDVRRYGRNPWSRLRLCWRWDGGQAAFRLCAAFKLSLLAFLEVIQCKSDSHIAVSHDSLLSSKPN
jgi:hypothetical protein